MMAKNNINFEILEKAYIEASENKVQILLTQNVSGHVTKKLYPPLRKCIMVNRKLNSQKFCYSSH